jgi:hypothetical protein
VQALFMQLINYLGRPGHYFIGVSISERELSVSVSVSADISVSVSADISVSANFEPFGIGRHFGVNPYRNFGSQMLPNESIFAVSVDCQFLISF